MTDTQRTLVIFGAGGDLTARLLLPGVGQLLASSRGEDLQLIGVDATEKTDDEWRSRVAESFAAGKATGDRVDRVIASTSWIRADVTKAEDLERVFAACTGAPSLYFALPPAVTELACATLESVDLPEGTVLCLEKPFGTDLDSAKALNQRLAALVPEERLHRVDHFLGKSTVINLLGLRFANRVFEALWNAEHVERVEIVFDEPLGLEGRAGYYDKAGALADMIQSHLLLVLALVTMEPPASIHADALRSRMADALAATRVRGDDPVASSRRARYTAGTIEGREFLSYADEPGVDPGRGTETLAELTVEVDTPRWRGVPFVLRSGKAIAGRRKDVLITFKPVDGLPDGFVGEAGPERLRIALTPDRLTLDISINGEGNPFTLDPTSLSADFADGELGPYGEVLAGIIAGDLTLSVRGDEVEHCWRIVGPVVDAWRRGDVPLDEYRAGSAGPAGWGL